MSSDSALSGALRRGGTARLVTGLAAISALGLGLLLVPGSPTAALTTTPFDCAAWITGGSTQARTIGGFKYNVTTLTSSGSLSIASGKSLVIDYLIVAPGGGGGRTSAARGGGGGGAGGIRSNLIEGTDSVTLAAGSQTITWGVVGAAAGSNGVRGGSGTNTTAFGVTATGGGGGGTSGANLPGLPGGSGGGGGGSGNANSRNGGAGETSPTEGQNGGLGVNSSAGGGGGGFGAVGGSAAANAGGAGGTGYDTSSLFGGSLKVAGGGGGAGVNSGGTAVTGFGGGNGGKSAATAAAATTATAGTGGGGGGGSTAGGAPSAGATGVILFRSRQFCQIPDAPTASRSGSTLNVVASAYKPAPGVSAMQYSILYRVGSAVSDWKVWAKSPVGWNPGAGTDVTLSTSTCPAVGGAWTCNPTQPMQAGTSYEIGVSARSGSTGIISNSPITLVGGGTWSAGP